MAYCQIWVSKNIASTCFRHSFDLDGLVKFDEFKNSPDGESKQHKKRKDDNT